MSVEFAFRIAIVVLTFFALGACGQNKVLSLNGEGAYVRLPSEVVQSLSEATIEGWVRWKSISQFAQPFGFGNSHSSLGFNQDGNSSALQYFVYDRDHRLHSVRIPGLLRLNRWFHVALTSGSDGMKCYIDGVLVGEHGYAGSFSSLSNLDFCFLGGKHWAENSFFHGEIDEFRIWDHARTVTEIRNSQFRPLTGSESGLVGLWNFDSGNANDSSLFQRDGELVGGARCSDSSWPSLSASSNVVRLEGILLDQSNVAVSNVELQWSKAGTLIHATTDQHGNYQWTGLLQPGEYQIHVVEHGSRYYHSKVVLVGGKIESELLLPVRKEITGRLIDSASEPFRGIVVEALSNDGVVLASCKSNVRGEYRLILAELDSCEVRCRMPSLMIRNSSDRSDTGVGFHIGAGPVPVDLEGEAKRTGIDFLTGRGGKGFWRTFSSFDGIGSDLVSDIELSRDRSLWIATWGSGLTRYNGSFDLQLTVDQHLPHNEVFAVEEDANKILWVATVREGLAAISGTEVVKRFSVADGLPSNAVRAIEFDQLGRTFVGTDYGAVVIENNVVEEIGALGALSITKFFNATDGTLWVGTADSGLFHHLDDRWIQYTVTEGLANNTVMSIEEGVSRDIWVGTNEGLTRIKDGEFTSYHPHDGLPTQPVMALHKDPEGPLWIGTDKGLYKFDEHRILSVGDNSGESFGIVSDILRDHDGSLWVSSVNGLHRYSDHDLLS